MKKSMFFASVFLLQSVAYGQSLYDLSSIQSIEIKFSAANWDYILDTAKAGVEGYTMADSVYINGVGYDSVGVKYKGNSSYQPSQVKNPFHIEMDTYKDQDYMGFKDIKLSNISFDPTFVREALAYKILGNYMDCPQANFANVKVNGDLMGLYTNVESIGKSFVRTHFGSKTNSFFSCSPPDGAGPMSTNLPSLVYLGASSTSYESAYEMKSDTGWNDLINLTNILSTTTATSTTSLEAVLDVDRALWMLAFDNLIVNLDSYIGQFKQNYYLYKSNNGQFMPIVWDLNMSFGVFGMTGSSGGGPGGPGGGGSLTTAAKKTLSHTLHSAESAWPLVEKLLAVPTYKKRYLAHYKTILSEMITSGTYVTDADAMQTLILASVTADVNKFSYQTVANMPANMAGTDVSVGSNIAPGVTGLMTARASYLNGLTDFTNTQPTISSIVASPASPVVGATVTITADVINTTSTAVYLGYRIARNDIFVKVMMYDDGAHGDGAAGDNVYGATIPVTGAQVQYYIYAENTNVGAFSPARAEYEFYTIAATFEPILPGELAINEIMASNATTVTDPAGDYEDWLELYNNTSKTLSLDDLYATDDNTNLLKWKFPNGITIAPHSYLIVWADGDLTEDGVHADFKFSSGGESCILSYDGGDIIDSVTFGAQTEDMGYARVPNGTGGFVIQAPTFNGNNEGTTSNINLNFANSSLHVYPNPVSNILNISDEHNIETVEVYNLLGQKIVSNRYSNKNKVSINLSAYANGMYLIVVNSESKVKVIKSN